MIIDPHQAFIRRTLLLLLACTALGAAIAALLHSRQAQPQALDLAVSEFRSPRIAAQCASP